MLKAALAKVVSAMIDHPPKRARRDKANRSSSAEVAARYSCQRSLRTKRFNKYIYIKCIQKINLLIDDYMKESIHTLTTLGVTMDSFKVLENSIGRGTYGEVKLVEKDGARFAMKSLIKEDIMKIGKLDHVFREQDILRSLDKHYFPKLYHTFQDNDRLYFVMELVPNGSLAQLLEQIGGRRLPIALARFYAANLLLAIEFLHSRKITHRDLKPQNILIDDLCYLKIIDFGDAKEMNDEEAKRESKKISDLRESVGSFSALFKAANDRDQVKPPPRMGTFVGTPLYVITSIINWIAPEMLEFNSSGYYTDLWALGCIIYEMIVGASPFSAKSKDAVFCNVLERKLIFPPDIDKDARDLIDKLLDIVPGNRLGLRHGSFDEINNYREIKTHPFFADFDFLSLAARQLRVPFNAGEPSLTTDSDEGSTSKKEESMMKKSGLVHDDISRYFDECCVYRARFLSRKYWEGEVKVRRKFFLMRVRYIILFEDGTVLVLRKGHIKMEFFIDETSQVVLNKTNRFTIKTSEKGPESFETPDAEVWVSIFKSIQKLHSSKAKIIYALYNQ